MKDLSFVDVDNARFPTNSSEYKDLILKNEKGKDFILCYHNTNSTKVPKVRSLDKVIEKQFVIPFVENMSTEKYNQILDLARINHFDRTVASIYGITTVNKSVAEFSPFLSQICAGALLTDKKGRMLTLIKVLEDGTDQLHIPQTHIEHSVDIYTKSLNQMICDSANKALNDAISVIRIDEDLAPINLISGYIVNTSQTLATSMHTLFATVYQIDDFENYHIRCRDMNQKAMILELNEAIDAARTHMMDPWLSYVYTNMIS